MLALALAASLCASAAADPVRSRALRADSKQPLSSLACIN
jgi:hypothetical protein